MYFCLHIPHFPAWAVERSLNERRAVAVVSSGRVVSASVRLARHGIVAGISAERVEVLAPEALVVPRDASLEEAAHEEMLHRLHALTPFLESDPPDVFYFRGGDESALRAFVRETGTKAGTAPHRTTARLVAARSAAGHLLKVPPAKVDVFLRRFPLNLLAELDFEEDLIERLGLFGFRSLGDMRRLTRRHFEAQFGDDGLRLHALLHPGDDPPVALFRPPPVIRIGFDFEPAVEEPGEIMPVLRHLVEETVEQLGNRHCRRLRLFLHEEDRVREGCRLLPESTASVRTLFNLTGLTMDALLKEEMRIHQVELELGALHYARSSQASLFRERPSVYQAVRVINRRFPGAIKKAVVHNGGVFPEDRWELVNAK